MKINAVHVNDSDTCVTLTETASSGDAVGYVENGINNSIFARQQIPAWHKMAIKSMKKGEKVYKYGAVIGLALEDIEPGDYVHVHNIRSPGIGV